MRWGVGSRPQSKGSIPCSTQTVTKTLEVTRYVGALFGSLTERNKSSDIRMLGVEAGAFQI